MNDDIDPEVEQREFMNLTSSIRDELQQFSAFHEEAQSKVKLGLTPEELGAIKERLEKYEIRMKKQVHRAYELHDRLLGLDLPIDAATTELYEQLLTMYPREQ